MAINRQLTLENRIVKLENLFNNNYRSKKFESGIDRVTILEEDYDELLNMQESLRDLVESMEDIADKYSSYSLNDITRSLRSAHNALSRFNKVNKDLVHIGIDEYGNDIIDYKD